MTSIQLAIEHQRAGRFVEAESMCRNLIAQDPANVEALNLLGIALANLGRPAEAIESFRAALAVRPDMPEIHNNLANLLRDTGRLDEAIASYRAAIALRPKWADKHDPGDGSGASGNRDDAVAAYRAAQSVRLINLAAVLRDTGELDEALACLRRAADNPRAADVFLHSIHFHPDYDGRRILEEHARWNQTYARPLAPSIVTHANDPSSDRVLRVGYVSADFCEHVVGYNMLPLLREHDRSRFEIFCFSNTTPIDSFTQRLKLHAGHWRDVRQLDDERLADLIRADGIDILVDLALHMPGNRLLTFARKPAPVQVTFAGYPGTTGLETMDYRLTDPYLDPAENDAFYSERSVRVADSFWCYEPPHMPPPVNELPAISNGFVTFASFSAFCKVNEPVLRRWARVMLELPASRLMLRARPGSHRAGTMDVMKSEGIEPHRVEFVDLQPWEQYMRTYTRVDVGLDTFPYNGHTTSLDSYLMGVPVVTLVGQTALSRAGWSHLCNLGMQDLASHTEDEFVRIAVELARDLPRLAEIRRTLRARMQASPLMDARRFARNVEAAYGQMWQNRRP